jgi:hypothetical protein
MYAWERTDCLPLRMSSSASLPTSLLADGRAVAYDLRVSSASSLSCFPFCYLCKRAIRSTRKKSAAPYSGSLSGVLDVKSPRTFYEVERYGKTFCLLPVPPSTSLKQGFMLLRRDPYQSVADRGGSVLLPNSSCQLKVDEGRIHAQKTGSLRLTEDVRLSEGSGYRWPGRQESVALSV